MVMVIMFIMIETPFQQEAIAFSFLIIIKINYLDYYNKNHGYQGHLKESSNKSALPFLIIIWINYLDYNHNDNHGYYDQHSTKSSKKKALTNHHHSCDHLEYQHHHCDPGLSGICPLLSFMAKLVL